MKAPLLALASLCCFAVPAAADSPPVPTKAAPGSPAAAKSAMMAKAAPPGSAKPGDAKPEVKRTPADETRRAQPLATFEGGQLTVGDMEDAIERQSPLMRARYTDPANMKELYDKTLRFALLAAEAERRGYAQKDSVAQAIKQNAVQALMAADFDESSAALAVSKDEIKKYYDEHVDEYVQSALQRASQIVLPTEADAKALLAEAKAADLRAFRQLARDKSIDAETKERGGDLRYFDASGKVRDEQGATVPPAIARAVFALKNVGDTAPAPIKVPNGFAIVKLTGSRPALSRKLPEAEETIRVRLWRERRQKAIEDFVAKLKTETPPELHPELASAINLDDAQAGEPPGVPEGDQPAEGKAPPE
jgi:peptidyl-prolyl cis-trans isomerase C